MTDKELLELAAKAAEIEGHSGTYFGDVTFLRDGHTLWNPLTDDGDALRLAVKLELMLWFRGDTGMPVVNKKDIAVEEPKLEKQAATRRAIVRAAAEIGKGMK